MKISVDCLTRGFMIVIFSIGIGSVQALAEDNQTAAGQAPAQTAHRGLDRKAKIEALKKLKTEHPEEFRRVVKERKEKVKEKLQELKEKDPEKYKEVTERMRERRKERLERLRQENPEKFREKMKEKAEKLNELKEKDPARYAEFMKNHPKLSEKIEKHEAKGHGYHRGDNLGVRDHGASGQQGERN